MARPGKPPAGTPLTEEELAVLVTLCLGGTKGTAAETIGCTRNAVRTYTLNIMARTRTRSMGHALAVAVARGEITIHTQPQGPLPHRQQRILIGFARGRSIKQIAAELGLSFHTIKSEITKLYRTLNGISRPHLVYLGFETGNLTVNRRKQNG